MRRLVAALALAAAGCAGTPVAREGPAGLAHPEPDPACRGTVQQSLALTGVEQVIVRVGVSREGRLAAVDVLTPDLTPAAALELRRALERCVWRPAIGPDGERAGGSVTLAIRR